MRASRPTPQGSSKSGEVDTGKQQPWKRKFAARDFRQDAPGIVPENRRTPSETGPWRGKLRKCCAILCPRKSRRFARMAIAMAIATLRLRIQHLVRVAE